jgi:hypothetical protein
MTQERKRYYKKQQTDNISAASVEMGNVPPQNIVAMLDEAYIQSWINK